MNTIAIPINLGEMNFIKQMSKAAEIAGSSTIRDRPDRLANLATDSLVGQLGTAALHKFWFGHLLEYARQRWYKNQQPYSGDGGHDIPVGNVDVKASLLKNPDKSKYHLLVRSRERHPNWVYVRALVELLENGTAMVYLMGWAATADLPSDPVEGGALDGAYAIPVDDLKPLPPLRWFWNGK